MTNPYEVTDVSEPVLGSSLPGRFWGWKRVSVALVLVWLIFMGLAVLVQALLLWLAPQALFTWFAGRQVYVLLLPALAVGPWIASRAQLGPRLGTSDD